MFGKSWDTSTEQSLRSLQYGPSVKNEEDHSDPSLIQVNQRVAIIAASVKHSPISAIFGLFLHLNLESRISPAPSQFLLRP